MRLIWDSVGSRTYQTGLDRGAFYPKTGIGVPWNGLISIDESDANTGESITYVDGQKVINQIDLGSFAATIEAFTYPDEFLPYDGYSVPMFSGQKKDSFDLTYRTRLGNDILRENFGYRLHLVYNCFVSPSERANASLNSDIEMLNFSWALNTIPELFPLDRPSAHLYIDSINVEPEALNTIENILYGTNGIDPRFPEISEVLSIFEANAIFIVVDNGDGTATITSSDDSVFPDISDPTLWTLVSPSVIPLTDILYKVSSY